MVSGGAAVLLVGWFSFLHGEATVGDVLAVEAVGEALARAGIAHDTAWSPVFRPAALHLDDLAPGRYSDVVFVCGPLHSLPPAPDLPSVLLELHRRFPDARRIAVGVSVPLPDDPAVSGFHLVLPRDGALVREPQPDLACHAPGSPALPVVGVILTQGQGEYGTSRRHDEAGAALTAWLRGRDAALLALDTRLDTRDWRLPATPAALHAVLTRLDLVVTTRLHGLALALRAGTPAIAVDPVLGGAKVSAQARALGWPAVLGADELDPARLDALWSWCLGPDGRQQARAAAARAAVGGFDDSLLRHLVAALNARRVPDGAS